MNRNKDAKMGYPPSGIMRMWLSRYWIAIFDALDIGASGFYANFEEFLQNKSDHSYANAKAELLSRATGEFAPEIKALSDDEDKIQAESDEFFWEELQKTDIGKYAKEIIYKKEDEISKLKEEINKLKQKPKQVRGEPSKEELSAIKRMMEIDSSGMSREGYIRKKASIAAEILRIRGDFEQLKDFDNDFIRPELREKWGKEYDENQKLAVEERAVEEKEASSVFKTPAYWREKSEQTKKAEELHKAEREEAEFRRKYPNTKIETLSSGDIAVTPKKLYIPHIEHGKDYTWLKNFILNDGIDDLNEAEKTLHEKGIDLTDIERNELNTLIYEKKKEFFERYKPEKIIIAPKPEEIQKKKKDIIYGRVVFKDKEREEKLKKEEETKIALPVFTPIIHELPKINVRNADEWLRTYRAYIPEMLLMGIPAWLVKHPEAEKFPVSLSSIRILAQQLDRKREPLDPLTRPSGREIEAQRLITSYIYQLMQSGLDEIIYGHDWDRWYQNYKDKTDFETFQSGAIQSVPEVAKKIFKF